VYEELEVEFYDVSTSTKEFLKAPMPITSSTSPETVSTSAASDLGAPPIEPVLPAVVLSTMYTSGVETRNQKEPLNQDDPLATTAPEKFTDPVPPTVPRLEPVALVNQVKAIGGYDKGEDPSPVQEDGCQQATKISRTLRRSRCMRLPGRYLILRYLERRRMKNLLTKPRKRRKPHLNPIPI
jgi:hypothetical protein